MSRRTPSSNAKGAVNSDYELLAKITKDPHYVNRLRGLDAPPPPSTTNAVSAPFTRNDGFGASPASASSAAWASPAPMSSASRGGATNAFGGGGGGATSMSRLWDNHFGQDKIPNYDAVNDRYCKFNLKKPSSSGGGASRGASVGQPNNMRKTATAGSVSAAMGALRSNNQQFASTAAGGQRLMPLNGNTNTMGCSRGISSAQLYPTSGGAMGGGGFGRVGGAMTPEPQMIRGVGGSDGTMDATSAGAASGAVNNYNNTAGINNNNGYAGNNNNLLSQQQQQQQNGGGAFASGGSMMSPLMQAGSGITSSSGDSIETLYQKSRYRLLALWEELGTPEADRAPLAQIMTLLPGQGPNVEGIRTITNEIQRLVDLRNAAVEVEKAIELREGFLYLLQELSERFASQAATSSASDRDKAYRELVALVTPFRNASLQTIEAIGRWRDVYGSNSKSSNNVAASLLNPNGAGAGGDTSARGGANNTIAGSSSSTAPYMWKGVSYLHKMNGDTYFLIHSRLGNLLEYEVRGNPLLDPRKIKLSSDGTTPALPPVRVKNAVGPNGTGGAAGGGGTAASAAVPFARISKAEQVLSEEAARQNLLRDVQREGRVLSPAEEAEMIRRRGRGDDDRAIQHLRDETQWAGHYNELGGGNNTGGANNNRGSGDNNAGGGGAFSKLSPIEIQNAAATNIQRIFKGHLARRYVAARREQVEGATRIQRFVRKGLARREVERRRQQVEAAKRIQALQRGISTRGKISKVRNAHAAATTIQRIYRGYLTRKYTDMVRYLHLCATKIQATWRSYYVRQGVRSEINYVRHNAATRIQAVWRGHYVRGIARYNPSKVRRVVTLQAWFRGILERKHIRELIIRRIAATRIQAIYRMVLAKRRCQAIRQANEDKSWEQFMGVATTAAIRIQSGWRMLAAKKFVAVKREEKRIRDLHAVDEAQIEENLQQQELLAYKHRAATKVQSLVRGHLARQQIAMLRFLIESTIKMQRVVRGHFGRVRARNQRAILIQFLEEKSAVPADKDKLVSPESYVAEALSVLRQNNNNTTVVEPTPDVSAVVAAAAAPADDSTASSPSSANGTQKKKAARVGSAPPPPPLLVTPAAAGAAVGLPPQMTRAQAEAAAPFAVVTLPVDTAFFNATHFKQSVARRMTTAAAAGTSGGVSSPPTSPNKSSAAAASVATTPITADDIEIVSVFKGSTNVCMRFVGSCNTNSNRDAPSASAALLLDAFLNDYRKNPSIYRDMLAISGVRIGTADDLMKPAAGDVPEEGASPFVSPTSPTTTAGGKKLHISPLIRSPLKAFPANNYAAGASPTTADTSAAGAFPAVADRSPITFAANVANISAAAPNSGKGGALTASEDPMAIIKRSPSQSALRQKHQNNPNNAAANHHHHHVQLSPEVIEAEDELDAGDEEIMAAAARSENGKEDTEDNSAHPSLNASRNGGGSSAHLGRTASTTHKHHTAPVDDAPEEYRPPTPLVKKVHAAPIDDAPEEYRPATPILPKPADDGDAAINESIAATTAADDDDNKKHVRIDSDPTDLEEVQSVVVAAASEAIRRSSTNAMMGKKRERETAAVTIQTFLGDAMRRSNAKETSAMKQQLQRHNAYSTARLAKAQEEFFAAKFIAEEFYRKTIHNDGRTARKSKAVQKESVTIRNKKLAEAQERDYASTIISRALRVAVIMRNRRHTKAVRERDEEAAAVRQEREYEAKMAAEEEAEKKREEEAIAAAAAATTAAAAAPAVAAANRADSAVSEIAQLKRLQSAERRAEAEDATNTTATTTAAPVVANRPESAASEIAQLKRLQSAERRAEKDNGAAITTPVVNPTSSTIIAVGEPTTVTNAVSSSSRPQSASEEVAQLRRLQSAERRAESEEAVPAIAGGNNNAVATTTNISIGVSSSSSPLSPVNTSQDKRAAESFVKDVIRGVVASSGDGTGIITAAAMAARKKYEDEGATAEEDVSVNSCATPQKKKDTNTSSSAADDDHHNDDDEARHPTVPDVSMMAPSASIILSPNAKRVASVAPQPVAEIVESEEEGEDGGIDTSEGKQPFSPAASVAILSSNNNRTSSTNNAASDNATIDRSEAEQPFSPAASVIGTLRKRQSQVMSRAEIIEAKENEYDNNGDGVDRSEAQQPFSPAASVAILSSNNNRSNNNDKPAAALLTVDTTEQLYPTTPQPSVVNLQEAINSNVGGEYNATPPLANVVAGSGAAAVRRSIVAAGANSTTSPTTPVVQTLEAMPDMGTTKASSAAAPFYVTASRPTSAIKALRSAANSRPPSADDQHRLPIESLMNSRPTTRGEEGYDDAMGIVGDSSESTNRKLPPSARASRAVAAVSAKTAVSTNGNKQLVPSITEATTLVQAILRYQHAAMIASYWREDLFKKEVSQLRNFAAHRIQMSFRAHAARAVMRQKKSEERTSLAELARLEEEREVEAVLIALRNAEEDEWEIEVIAKHNAKALMIYRRELAVIKASERLYMAALKIQCAWRCYNARFMVRWMRDARLRSRQEKADAENYDRGTAAAIRIQCQVRRRQATQRTDTIRTQRRDERNAKAAREAQAHDAAVKIQCLVRSHNARDTTRYLREKKAQQEQLQISQRAAAEAAELKKITDREDAVVRAQTENAAALTMQCAWRSYNARFQRRWRQDRVDAQKAEAQKQLKNESEAAAARAKAEDAIDRNLNMVAPTVAKPKIEDQPEGYYTLGGSRPAAAAGAAANPYASAAELD